MDDFIKRLEYLLDYYSLNASSFADKIGVQRSSLSHLLSGRNKPSLDFIMKITEAFPEVNLYWILNNKGQFLKSDFEKTPYTPFKNESVISSEKNEIVNLFSQSDNSSETKKNVESIVSKNNENKIIKIVIFYNDGTFEDFTSK